MIPKNEDLNQGLMSDAQGKETDRLIETVSIAPPRFSAKARFLGGGICILILVATWILQAELLGSPQPGEWNKPFLREHSTSLFFFFSFCSSLLLCSLVLSAHGMDTGFAGCAGDSRHWQAYGRSSRSIALETASHLWFAVGTWHVDWGVVLVLVSPDDQHWRQHCGLQWQLSAGVSRIIAVSVGKGDLFQDSGHSLVCFWPGIAGAGEFYEERE